MIEDRNEGGRDGVKEKFMCESIGCRPSRSRCPKGKRGGRKERRMVLEDLEWKMRSETDIIRNKYRGGT